MDEEHLDEEHLDEEHLDEEHWHKHGRDKHSLNTIIEQAAESIGVDISSDAVSFLARRAQVVEERINDCRELGKPMPYNWQAYEQYASQNEAAVAIYGGDPIDDYHCIPEDDWLAVDGMFPEVLYGTLDARREQEVLFTLLSRYERLDLKLDSGRTWVVMNPVETRDTLREARRLYDFEKRAFLSCGDNFKLNLQETRALGDDWYKELDEYVVEDARR